MIILTVLLSAFVITLSLAHYTYRVCFYSPKDRLEDPYAPLEGAQYAAAAELLHKCTAVMEQTPFRWVSIQSDDGLTLKGRYYHIQDNAPLMLIFHGYRSSPLRDCAGGFALALRLGFNILAPDQRSHGTSDGKAITFGILERRDCLQWTQYAVKELTHGAPIILSGISMGAATVLMASQLKLPDEVCCIAADCPYASPKEIIQKVCADRGYPVKLTYPFVWLGAKIFGGFALHESTATDAVKNTKIPMILLHGEADSFVPCEMSRRIHAAAPDISKLYTFPYAEHGLCCITDPIRYENATISFFQSIEKLKPYLQEITKNGGNYEEK